jgi:Kef-type K+ transport system membrane component KefB
LDDILGMIVLAVVSSLASGAINYPSLIAVGLEAVGLTALILLFGPRLARRLDRTVAQLSARNSAFIPSIIMCLSLSFASHYIGMAAIIGAFPAGLALAEQSEQWRLRESTGAVSDFLTPFFFVLISAQVNLRTLFQPGLLAILVAICSIAFISKLIGWGLASLSLGWRNALRVGVGMIPRGEVGLIVAAVGLRLHTISEAVYLVLVGMSLVTTLLTPPILRLLMPRPAPEEGR